MKIENLIKKYNKNVLFVLIFTILGFVALQIPVNVLAGSRVRFTLFDLFGPISGAFLGSVFGIIAVSSMQLINLVTHGFNGVDSSSVFKLIATLRFLPMIFGVWYFVLRLRSGSTTIPQRFGQGSYILLIPVLAIIIFNLHPIGRQVWFYSLFWLIPLVVWPLRDRFLVLRSLGSTFTAHAVGGAIWIWAFNLPANVWIGLIPVVILERSIFALGISASYILMNNVLGYLSAKKLVGKGISVDKRYLLKT